MKKSKAKGFVYTIMHCTFANSTQKVFCQKLLFLYQEFITVRNRKKFSVTNEYTFTPCLFKNTYKGCIVTPKIIIPTRKTDPGILKNGKQWVDECKEQQMSIDEIARFVQTFFHNKKVITVNFFHSAENELTRLSMIQAINESEHCLSSYSNSICLNILLNMAMTYNTVLLFMEHCINNITYFNFKLYLTIASKYDRAGQL